MKNRKSIIAGAILSIMLCVSIVAGATFALFETKDEINVSVGSANVKITATIGDLETYSYDATENAQIKTAANGTFTAGGTATVGANGSLVLDRIAAGDKVTFNLNVKNESNIKTKWRTVVKCLNGRELYDGLAITLGGETKTVTAYEDLDIAPEGGETKTVAVSIELPYEAGNEFLNKNCELVVRAEAVQANAAITEVAEATEVKNSLANGGTTLLSSDIELSEAVTVAGGNATLDLNGNTLTAKKDIVVNGGGTLEITNGKVLCNKVDGKRSHVAAIGGGTTITLDNAVIEGEDDGLFIQNDGNSVGPTLNVKNSSITAKTYCISTNAATSDHYNVVINVENSILVGNSVIMANIPSIVNIKNCTVLGGYHGVIVRSGTVNIEDTTIFSASDASVTDYFETRNWGSGNMVELASLTVGNRNGGYVGNAECNLKNVTILRNGAVDGSKAVFITGGNVFNEKQYGASLTFDENCKIGVATLEDGALNVSSIKALEYNDNVKDVIVDSKAPDRTKISINGTALN